MNHGVILPILLPMFAGSLLLLGAGLSLRVKRSLSLVATLLLLPLSGYLLWLADQDVLQVYAAGNWAAPFGIILLLDRLSALLLVVTAVLGSFALLYAVRGDDERGQSFPALFAIMTKVGLYSISRVYTLIFGDEAGSLANMANDWLWPIALLTLALGVIGALAAVSLQGLLAYLVVVSVGTLLAGIAIGTEQALAAALYYLVHSTWVAGGLFLLADLIARQRGDKQALLVQGPALQNPHLLGGLFFFGAIAVAGLPPLSGFIGKLLLLRSLEPGVQALMLWSVVLGGGLLTLVAL